MRHSFDVVVTSRLSLSLCLFFYYFFLLSLVFYDFTSHFLLFSMFYVGFFYIHFFLFISRVRCFICFYSSAERDTRNFSFLLTFAMTIERTEIQLNVVFFLPLYICLFTLDVCANAVVLLLLRRRLYRAFVPNSTTVDCMYMCVELSRFGKQCVKQKKISQLLCKH